MPSPAPTRRKKSTIQPTSQPTRNGTHSCMLPKTSKPGFQITLFNKDCGTDFDNVFQAAAHRWEQVITGEAAGGLIRSLMQEVLSIRNTAGS